LKRLSPSLKIYLYLVLVLAVSNVIQLFLPSFQGLLPSTSLPAPLPVIALVNAAIAIVVYGGLGFAGLKLSARMGFTGISSPEVNNRQRLLIPGIIGLALGVVLILADLLFSRFNGIGRLLHPSFPASIFASLSAGIGEEILFRLFFIPFWVWIISSLILRGRGRNPVFWVITIVSALVFALGHLPALMLLFNFTSVSQISPALILQIVLLNGVISIFAAYYMRKYGFLAAVSIHFWTDVVWHVVWGLF
jgi:membrane protease YdiL (CAAX protease family)